MGIFCMSGMRGEVKGVCVLFFLSFLYFFCAVAHEDIIFVAFAFLFLVLDSSSVATLIQSRLVPKIEGAVLKGGFMPLRKAF